MVSFTKAEISKLASVCSARYKEYQKVLESKKATTFEKAIAENECEYMVSLFDKLLSAQDAKVIGIK